ncbi:DMT family transporter [Amycolatopsis suaedae]|uniref:DMT family transporter n=1 Tax=Amycolatopsis suaedae TaxID=2510978 RepID=A0A4Q7IZW1_9PSEU|nr:DMT family transporter [Amycolatopsis suaedae]RZQ59978.1 DMT family transporter [Amycolatopsis suaedae]
MSLSVVVDARAKSRAVVALVAAGVLWGTGGIAGSLLAQRAGLHPQPVAAYRLLVAGGCGVLFLAVTGGARLPRTRAAAVRLVVAGALLALFQTSYFAAVTLTSVSVATMTTIGSLPVFVAAGAAVLDRQRPDARTLISVAAAVAGVVLLSGSSGAGASGWRLVAGVALALLAGAGFAALTLVNRRQVAGLDGLRVTTYGCLVGGVLLLPAGLAFGMTLPLRADVLALALYLGAVPTMLGYAAYLRGLRDARPVFAALAALLEPLTAAVLAAVLLGEHLGVLGWCGAALLVAALAGSYSRR